MTVRPRLNHLALPPPPAQPPRAVVNLSVPTGRNNCRQPERVVVAEHHGKRAAPAPAPEPMPPEALEMVKAMQAEHYRRWLDEEIPALGGLTPRAAAKGKGAPRDALRLLLAEFENSEARQPAALRFDVASLRRELGID